jgi:V/A-type H+-transporting ATPase subunit I
MIFPAGMKKIEFLIFKTDIDKVIEYLGKARCFQLSDRVEGERSDCYTKLEETYRNLLSVWNFLGRDFFAGQPASDISALRVPREEDIAEAEKIFTDAGPLVEQEKILLERRQKALNILDEIDAFRRLDLPLRDIESVTFLAYRIGVVSPDSLEGLRGALGNRALILDLNNSGRIFAISSKKGRFALDTELKKVGFRDTPIPDEIKTLPPDVANALEAELAATNELLENLNKEKAVFAARYERILGFLFDIISVGIRVEDLKGHLMSTETAYSLSGWIPSAESKKVVAGLEAITNGRIAIRAYAPEEVEAVKEGREKIPVKLQHGKFLQSFSGIVISYGAPLYGTVDPTALVSFFFVLLFAIMFGDVGQGFVGLVIGFLLAKEKIPAFRGWERFAPIFKIVGCACMVTGFLYGSVFCNEELLVPATRFISGRLFGREMDRFVTLLPNHGIDKILVFFGFTIGIGVLINSIGLIINMYNRFKLRDYRRAIFAKTGALGAFLFWYAVIMAVRLGQGSVFRTRDIVCISIPLVLLFWGEPLYRLFSRERPLFPEGIFSFIMEGFVEVMETVSYFISNSVSFLRVGAFALSHAVLSLIIFTLVDLLESVPGGIIFQIFVLLAGNVLIIVLEGLIVSIQVIRLQYYEFFSKFFTESGEAFKPFELNTPQH